MKLLYSILIILISISCSKKPEKPKIDSSKVILSAEILKYDDLKYLYADELKYDFYCYPRNWRDGEEFKKEDSFFVKAKIDNTLLAALSESDGFEISHLISSNPHFLYGKYVNRWEFVDSTGNIICETEKFEGQRLIELKRNFSVDEVIVGPLKTKPLRMTIKILNSKYYKTNSNPTLYLK